MADGWRYYVETLGRAVGAGYTSRARRLWHWILWVAFKRWHDGPALECIPCGEVHCGEPLHFHHDGCPACDCPDWSAKPPLALDEHETFLESR